MRYIDECIKEVWLNDIYNDYIHRFLLKEDSLKNVFYRRLCNRLSDGFLLDTNIRVFTEYRLPTKQKVDLAIVQLNDENSYIVSNNYAFIELKHKKNSNEALYRKDIEKVLKYINNNEKSGSQFYLGFLHDCVWPDDNDSWLNEDEVNSSNGRVTELNQFYNADNKLTFAVKSYNWINQHLNKSVSR